MGKSHPDASKDQRQRPRQLSIIYFVDAARTHTMTISFGRLRLLGGGLLCLFLWSIGSVFLTVHFVRAKVRLQTHLKQALSSIFEYETRDEQVFDIAYPPVSKSPVPTALVEAPVVAAPPSVAQQAPSPAVASVPAVGSSQADAPADKGAMPTDDPGLSANKSALPVDKAAPKSTEPVQVLLGKVQFESSQAGLNLQMELTNKSSSKRVEGYIYAVAEFVSDQGEHFFISSPKGLKADAAGAEFTPQKSVRFGISRFKDKRFSFAITDGMVGAFTKVRVELIGRDDSSRSTYDFSVPSASNRPTEHTRSAKTSAPQPG